MDANMFGTYFLIFLKYAAFMILNTPFHQWKYMYV